MTDHNLPNYLNKAQSTIDTIKKILRTNDLQKVLDKLDNLPGLRSPCPPQRFLTHPDFPTMENLINHLLQVPSLDASSGIGSSTDSEPLDFFLELC